METTVLPKHHDWFLDNPWCVVALCIAVIVIVVAIVAVMVYQAKDGTGKNAGCIVAAIGAICIALLLYMGSRRFVNAAFKEAFRGSTKGALNSNE